MTNSRPYSKYGRFFGTLNGGWGDPPLYIIATILRYCLSVEKGEHDISLKTSHQTSLLPTRQATLPLFCLK